MFRKFRRTLTRMLIASGLLVAYLADHSVSAYQSRTTALIAVLLCMLSLAVAFLVTFENPQAPKSMLTEEQKRNALLFRHQPKAADFRVREIAARSDNRRPPRIHRVV